MTPSQDELRAGLQTIAAQAESVDLYERSLARSHQIGHRRAVTAVSTAFVVLALVALGTWQFGPRVDSAPLPPASPLSPTASQGLNPSFAPVPPADLSYQTIDLPPWPAGGACPTKRVVLKMGELEATDDMFIKLLKTVAVDLNHDGVPEAIALLACYGPGQGAVYQVAAYRGPAGALVLLGQVTWASTQSGKPTQFSYLEDIEAANPGVRVKGTNGQPGFSPSTYDRIQQWRTYGWNGSAFIQTAGSTTFTADPARVGLSVVPSTVVLGPVSDGCRTGTMTLRLRNTGPQAAADVTVALLSTAIDTSERCAPEASTNASTEVGDRSALVHIGDLSAGTTKTVTVTMRIADTKLTPGRIRGGYNEVELRTGDLRSGQRLPLVVQVT